MRNLCGTWKLLSVEPLCGTLGNLYLYAKPLWNLETLKCGTSKWNLGEPGATFPLLPQTTPKLYWKNPKLCKLLGKNTNFPRALFVALLRWGQGNPPKSAYVEKSTPCNRVVSTPAYKNKFYIQATCTFHKPRNTKE